MKPTLYTFRRCPYAIRARLAIAVSEIEVEKIEVDLRNKPTSLLEASPKGTVPVLKLPDGKIIDQSLDIMLWALRINDPQEWMQGAADLSDETLRLILWNDGKFKHFLDRYKYADRHPEYTQNYYREEGEKFLTILNNKLSEHTYLMDDQPRFADFALFPFIRQFAYVDKDWFYSSPYSELSSWLDRLTSSSIFIDVMQK